MLEISTSPRPTTLFFELSLMSLFHLVPVYYQIFEDGMAGTARNSIPELNEPSIGRLRARDIAPPRTVGIIKRAIAKAEDIPLSRIADLFLLAHRHSLYIDSSVIFSRFPITGEFLSTFLPSPSVSESAHLW